MLTIHTFVGFDGKPPTAPKASGDHVYGTLFGEYTTDVLLEALCDEEAGQDSLRAIATLSSVPRDYSAAACIFRWTRRSINAALDYYQLNERCTDAIELIRAHARAYDYLASFESDLPRKVNLCLLWFCK